MEIRQGVSLKDWTWWKIGGAADFFCLPASVAQVREAVEFAHGRGLPITILGGGTNVLVSDQGVEGLVICMKRLAGVKVEERDGRIFMEALAGSAKSELTKVFLRWKLAPALFLCGLPGDVAGGIVMNAGVGEAVSPREFVEITDWVEVLDLSSCEIRRLNKSDLQWSYRSSQGWQPGLIVRAGLSWPNVADLEISRKVKEATKMRVQRQPIELPSCGSTFRNPLPERAGALIEKAGLKGMIIGGAQISPKHANFIVNLGNASAQDVWQIIQQVRSEVKSRFAIELETEVKLMGRW